MAKVPVEYTARWSAGANILGFISTIVGLMSNSIEEITSVADESLFLAIALAMSSVTTFNSRFGDRTKRLSETLFDEKIPSASSMQIARSRLRDLVEETQKPRPLWQHRKLQSCIWGLVAISIGAGVWYEVVEITTYGIVAFACPVKANIAIWVGLSQLLALTNVLCRKLLFHSHVLNLKPRNVGPRGRGQAAASRRNTNSCKIVLLCPRSFTLKRLLKTFNAFASFSLYAYGTFVLASTTLVPASDAIRAMVVAAASAGFGRLAAHCFTSSWRTRSRLVVLVVDASCLDALKDIIQRDFGTVP